MGADAAGPADAVSARSYTDRVPGLTYLDHGATTPVLPAALDAYAQVLATVGNPSSLHAAGRDARRIVEESRERIAELVGARPSEVVFTSGGTEADNLAVVGTHRARRTDTRDRVLVSGAEHHAVLESAEHLAEREGARITWIEVDELGRVTPDALRVAIGEHPEDVTVASVMWANNEVGTISPVSELAAIAAEHGIPLHTDAVQAVGHVPFDFAAAGVEAASMTGHKLGAPVGTGALLLRRDATLEPLTHGGGQERSVRSGTLNTAGVRALAVAVEEAVTHLESEAARLVGLRDALLQGALDLGLDIRVGGAWTPGSYADRLPGNAHLIIPGAEGDSLLYLLDAAGVQCSTGSACQAGVPQASHVLLAMGVPDDVARGALRMTLGHTSTQADIDAALAALPGVVARARRAHA